LPFSRAEKGEGEPEGKENPTQGKGVHPLIDGGEKRKGGSQFEWTRGKKELLNEWRGGRKCRIEHLEEGGIVSVGREGGEKRQRSNTPPRAEKEAAVNSKKKGRLGGSQLLRSKGKLPVQELRKVVTFICIQRRT